MSTTLSSQQFFLQSPVFPYKHQNNIEFSPKLMAFSKFSLTLIMIYMLIVFCFKTELVSSAESDLQTYIVHVELPPGQTMSSNSDDLHSWYQSFLPPSALSSTDDEPRMIYAYRNVFKGFAAKLTPDEVKAMEEKPGFVSAYPEEKLSLYTTHSPNFLGLQQGLGFWQSSNYGKGVIIGVLDTGIVSLDHPSFTDNGMPPPPAKWRGACQFDPPATCNNKVIGVRKFRIGNGTPFDEDGHGTHTAGTAAGNFVPGANVFGNANGTAVGTAPMSHLAIYKVCSASGCSDTDIVAAIDMAIDDGVDVLSLSLGGIASVFYQDSIAVAAFSAMAKGIFVSCSAGNSGPSHGTLSNGAPWVLTVGASTIDRKIIAVAKLGNGEEFEGETAFQPNDFPSTLLPLVYPMNANDSRARFCFPESLRNVDVRGKIVVCDVSGGIGRISKGRAVRNSGGLGMILVNRAAEGYSTHAEVHVLPATHISYAGGLKLKAYINSTTTPPTATILFKGTIIGDNHAPMVSSFSSRGPNPPSLGILKPDIIGPGANIIAAWHESVENRTNTRASFNIISGTSMSCPHLSGIVALIRSTHPDWSPAAIKSALMTTADVQNLGKSPIEDQDHVQADVFATGSGHVNPSRANDPGLVYDIQPDDYIPYLCGLNYTDSQIRSIVDQEVRCAEIRSIPEAQLNYPTFSVILGENALTYTRTVTNVGLAISLYSVKVDSSQLVNVTVEPEVLQFSELKQNLTYRVTFARTSSENLRDGFVQGALTWSSAAKYVVRSSFAVLFE